MSPHILLVDDTPENLKEFRSYLETKGYNVTTANSDEEALALLEETAYDLLLVDVCLHGQHFVWQDHFFFDTLRRQYTSVPVVAITGKPLKATDVTQLLKLGPVALIDLGGDFNFQQFITELNDALPTRESRCIMFTDIKGATGHFSKFDDNSGLTMVQKHNQMLFPIISQNNGGIIKTIGDSIMADFGGPQDAVAAAILMQRALADYNENQQEVGKIHIRIGIHSGYVIAFRGDRFGNVVNIASRIEALDDTADRIYITQEVYNDLDRALHDKCDSLGEHEIRGTGRKYTIYEVDWT